MGKVLRFQVVNITRIKKSLPEWSWKSLVKCCEEKYNGDWDKMVGAALLGWIEVLAPVD